MRHDDDEAALRFTFTAPAGGQQTHDVTLSWFRAIFWPHAYTMTHLRAAFKVTADCLSRIFFRLLPKRIEQISMYYFSRHISRDNEHTMLQDKCRSR